MAFDFPNAPTVGQTYQGYVWDGEKWVSISAPAAPNQSGVIGVQVFTASGQYIPSANMTTCVIECVGGGGGGGGVAVGTSTTSSAAGGGGGGGYTRKMYTVAAIGVAQSVVVGAGGSAGAASNSPGGTGGTTTFMGMTAAGGVAGVAGTTAATASNSGVLGGIGSGGDVNSSGGPGGGAIVFTSASIVTAQSGFGGNSLFGGGGNATSSGPGVSGTGRGSGGGGAACYTTSTAAAGGAGASGVVIVTEYGMTALSPATAQLGSVRYDLPQGLTANQTAQARANIQVTKKNYIINGAMMISQENGSTASTVNAYFMADQWQGIFSNAATQTFSQAAAGSPGGSPNRIVVLINVADASVGASDNLVIMQTLEGLRTADLKFGTVNAKTITIQFCVTAPAGTYSICLVNGAANRSFVAEYVIAAGEAGQDVIKSVTIPGDTTGTWSTSNTASMYLKWGLMAGTSAQQAAGSWGTGNPSGSPNQFNLAGSPSNSFYLCDVSLTEGSVAPPFQVPDYVSELALCKRYFYNGIPKLAGVAISAVSASRLGGNHPVIMRAAPTVAIITALPIQTASGGTATVTGIGTNYSTAGTLEFDGVSSSLPGGFVHTYQGAGGNISVNARL